MNRFVRAVVSTASMVGGLAGVPALAHAQPVNVAPPAYVQQVPPPQPAQYAPGYYQGHTDERSAYGYRGEYNGNQYGREGWQPQYRRDAWERIRRHHLRECARAYANGAPPWVLEGMRCPLY